MATMKVGLTRKLRASEVRKYKKSWEERCAQDLEVLARDRLAFYATAYKNPPRIRQLFLKLTPIQRFNAASILQEQILQAEPERSKDKGYDWQHNPRTDDLTLACLHCLASGELWPSCLPRVRGHERDPDYPTDLGPPNGMLAFHGYDLYCQLLVRALWATHSGIALEQLRGFEDPEDINRYAGTLVSFRENSHADEVPFPFEWEATPACQIQFERNVQGCTYKTIMNLKTMYIFSDTASQELETSRVCGVGLLGGAKTWFKNKSQNVEIFIKPLIIGTGGLGQSDEDGLWMYNERGASSDL